MSLVDLIGKLLKHRRVLRRHRISALRSGSYPAIIMGSHYTMEQHTRVVRGAAKMLGLTK